MKREVLLLLASSLVTVVVALGLIRWFAPGLLGGPADLQLVQLADALPAYYQGVFRADNDSGGEFLLKDPLTRVRARPLYPRYKGLGPHDILGFRNSAVPVVADIVTIGDSMTYGNNAVLEQNWPSYLSAHLRRDDIKIYNMATGGWAATQYLDMFAYAQAFRPRVVIVAFYTGNDPLETFQMVYGNPHWRHLIPDDTLSAADAPDISLQAEDDGQWEVVFADGIRTVFTPRLRLASNAEHPAVAAGYAIMANTAAQLSNLAQARGISLVFTIIPTKELVYAGKVAAEGHAQPADYARLIAMEQRRIAVLRGQLEALSGVLYIDTLQPLQQAAMDGVRLYPETVNGHPLAAGYEVIGRVLAAAVAGLLPPAPAGLYALMDKDTFEVLLVNSEGVWNFNSFDLIEANGWPPAELRTIELRDLVKLPHHGTVTAVDPARFGPACCPAREPGQTTD